MTLQILCTSVQVFANFSKHLQVFATFLFYFILNVCSGGFRRTVQFQLASVSATLSIIITRDSVAIARIILPYGNSVCPSVCHTGGSVKNG